MDGEAQTTNRITRRRMIAGGAAALAMPQLLIPRANAADVPGAERPREGSAAATNQPHADQTPLPPAEPGKDYTPVVTPNGTTLPYKLVDGVKVFHLVAEPIKHEMVPGLVCDLWCYNGQAPGPTIEAVEGDRVRIYLTNKLPEPTSLHCHGLLLPCGMDGVSGVTQRAIEPGETFKYEFTLRQHGSHMYHPHFDEMVQIAMGMMGMFIIHPRNPKGPRPDRDFAIILSEWAIEPGASRPDPNEMTDFNILTMNHRAFPGTAPLVAKKGDRVRIRFGNLSPMDHHPIHLHGYQFKIVETDGGQLPESAQWPETTVLVPVGSTRTIEFVADEPGDWVMHCHMTHHMMNQMGHDVPNLIGMNADGLDERIRRLLPDYMTMGQTGMGGHGEHMAHMAQPENSVAMKGGHGPFGYIDMGGMFTILKVRDALTSYDDPGWYEHPPGTVAVAATPDELRRDGIATGGATPAPPTAAVYTCPHHPEVTSPDPGRCPKCRMTLKPKK